MREGEESLGCQICSKKKGGGRGAISSLTPFTYSHHVSWNHRAERAQHARTRSSLTAGTSCVSTDLLPTLVDIWAPLFHRRSGK